MKNKATIIISILTALCLCMGLFIAVSRGKIKLTGKSKALYEVTFDQPVNWQGKDSTWHSKAESVQVRDPELVAELSKLSERVVGLDKNLKNLTSYSKVGTETIIHATVVKKDSVIFYNTKYDTLIVTMHGDSADIFEKHIVNLTEVEFWDRSWLFGKKKYFKEFISEDPNTKVFVNKSIKPQRKRGLFKRE